MKKKILISGGHLTPALAFIDQSISEQKDYSFVFLGRVYSQEATQQLSQEKKEVEQRGVVFVPTVAPKFHKTYWWRNVSELQKWWPSLSIAWQVVSRFRPDVYLSFGGYLAFPIALVCRIRNIPILTHEQTSTVGLANTLISFLSAKIAVSYPESLQSFPAHKTVLTGNPMRPSVLTPAKKRPDWIKKIPTLPIIYITGGNQGSEILNTVVEQTLSQLTTKWFVIHQCGNPHSHSDYVTRLQNRAKNLTPLQRSHYCVRAWVSESELSWIFSQASVVISRSGANTVQEVMYHKVPAVFIPLPFSHNQEQQKNAEILEKAGSALILEQQYVVPETFLSSIQEASRKNDTMRRKAESVRSTMITDGAHRLIECVEQILKERKFYIEKE